MKKTLFIVVSVILMMGILVSCAAGATTTAATTAATAATTKAAGTTTTAATTKAASAEKPKVTLVIKNLTNPMWIAVKTGAEKAAADLNVDLTVAAPTKADNNEEQIGIIQQAIAKKVSALVVIPADSVGIVPAIEEANKANIPVINVNTKVDLSSGAKVKTFIAVENYTAAVSVAEKLAELMGKKGKIIILEGKAGAQSSIDIVKGAKDTFAKYTDIKILASQTANWSRSEALNVTQNLLQAHPDVEAIFAANDEMAMGAVEAVNQAGKSGKIRITGLDANADARKAVDEGKMLITCDKNGYDQGYQGVAAAVKVLKGETLADFIKINTALYVKK